jgi:DNA-binding PadR family transcriptional regulator
MHGTGFVKLEKDGFISIQEIRGQYIASLTDKGFEVLYG